MTNIYYPEEIRDILRDLVSTQDNITHYNLRLADKVDYEKYLGLIGVAKERRARIISEIVYRFTVLVQEREDAINALEWAMDWIDLEYDRNNPNVDPEWADKYDAAKSILRRRP